jgi:uncharacterized membrane protein
MYVVLFCVILILSLSNQFNGFFSTQWPKEKGQNDKTDNNTITKRKSTKWQNRQHNDQKKKYKMTKQTITQWLVLSVLSFCPFSFGHCVVVCFVILSFFFWSLCCLFCHFVLFLLVIEKKDKMTKQTTTQRPKEKGQNDKTDNNTMTKRKRTKWQNRQQHNDQKKKYKMTKQTTVLSVLSFCTFSFGHCVVVCFVILSFFFWSLCCFLFCHFVLFLLVIVLLSVLSFCTFSFGHCVVVFKGFNSLYEETRKGNEHKIITKVLVFLQIRPLTTSLLSAKKPIKLIA